jgi:JmjC domain, hydroxylase
MQREPGLLYNITTMLDPTLLQQSGLEVHRLCQRAGEFVITFPKAYHAGNTALLLPPTVLAQTILMLLLLLSVVALSAAASVSSANAATALQLSVLLSMRLDVAKIIVLISDEE